MLIAVFFRKKKW